ncbi:hypothetical protein LQ327_03020 [Actinomycetospora endophytica]|uniref:Uncharacterized protein n=1 Tax=Actinomycetospora endophytica TaxID=2291215 RepID=A0ABS8P5Q5_9PSEU|nr:hypothetical protein [Actinomycetospora endophytica]MCD2192369.1 hypothetical protein [Actinomycetospora endophytica]
MSLAQWWRRQAWSRRDAGSPDSGTPEERRFSQVYAEDRVGPIPYPDQASPDVAAARGRVRALVSELLPGGVDEGTGGALDPLIASWASGWLARVDSEHADHHALIDRLVGGARRQLADAEATHERDRHALEIARRDYADARERLMDLQAPPGTADAGPGRRGLFHRRRGRAANGPAEPPTGPILVAPGPAGPADDEPATDQPLAERTGEPR